VSGTTIVTINGKLYKVRLLKGRGDGLNNAAPKGYDVLATHGSEWNRLMYHVSGKPFGNASNTLASEGIIEGDWARFNASQLLTDYTYGKGSWCWCQEAAAGYRTLRGYLGVSYFDYDIGAFDYYGWRPCLELIE
jgi:hypothetical protein